jgi:hypothetical protein
MRAMSRLISADTVVLGFIVGIAAWTFVALPLIYFYSR